MSYCRNNGTDSDVYVYSSALTNGQLLECTCGSEGHFLTREKMLLHLVKHLQNGDKVPFHVFQRLIEEILEEIESQDDSGKELEGGKVS